MSISSFHLRVLSGFVLGPLFVGAIYLGGIAFQAVVAVCFGLAVKEWIDMTRQGKYVIRDSVFGIFYLLVCFASFIKIRTDLDEGMYLTIVLFLGVVASDVFAYFSGKFFKGPKLLPIISPNKTWAGLIGGLFGSALVLYVLNLYQPFLAAYMAIIVGAAFTIVGQVGDLMISAYKRRVGVKDTGSIIPGHGGILDRIDSLALVTPFFLIVILELGI